MLSIFKIFLIYFLAAGVLSVLGIYAKELIGCSRKEFLISMEVLADDAEVPLWQVYVVFTLSIFVGGFVFIPYALISYVKNNIDRMIENEEN